MRIVNLETFSALPPDTLFAKYEPCVFGELQIKGETLGPDFLVTSGLASAIKCNDSGELMARLERAELLGESLALDFDSQGRDGCFDSQQLFAVWEDADVQALLERLKRCLHGDQPKQQQS